MSIVEKYLIFTFLTLINQVATDGAYFKELSKSKHSAIVAPDNTLNENANAGTSEDSPQTGENLPPTGGISTPPTSSNPSSISENVPSMGGTGGSINPSLTNGSLPPAGGSSPIGSSELQEIVLVTPIVNGVSGSGISQQTGNLQAPSTPSSNAGSSPNTSGNNNANGSPNNSSSSGGRNSQDPPGRGPPNGNGPPGRSSGVRQSFQETRLENNRFAGSRTKSNYKRAVPQIKNKEHPQKLMNVYGGDDFENSKIPKHANCFSFGTQQPNVQTSTTTSASSTNSDDLNSQRLRAQRRNQTQRRTG